MTIRESVTAILDSSPGETFSLWGLTDRVGLRKGEEPLDKINCLCYNVES
jgi:hypothetical protein